MGRRPTKSPKVVNKAKPTCGEMIEAAITNLSEKSGSSKSDILKYMKANWNVDASIEKAMEAELRKAVKDGNIVQTTKGKSKTRLFKINKSNTTPKSKPVEDVVKCETLKKKTSEDNKEGEASKPDIKSETMTRAKLPVKVKEAKEKKKAAAAAKRETAKKRKKGKRRKKGAKGRDNSRAAEIRAAAKRGIPKKILDAFEEIWNNM